MVTKTEIEFSYEPGDYFEQPISLPTKHGHLSISTGKVVYSLATPADPVPRAQQDEAERETRMAFDLRALQTNRRYTLSRSSITQYGKNGSTGKSISVSVNEMVMVSATVDLVVKDATGKVKQDSRAERAKRDQAFIQALLPKFGNATLVAMLEAYRRALVHPTHELVHLYEVRDACKKHFGSDEAARRALGISDSDWKELGRLANDAPLKQGRHSGKHIAGLRDASPEELAEARRIARKIIEGFANTLP